MSKTKTDNSFLTEIAPYMGAYAEAIVSNIRLAVLNQYCKIIWVNERFCHLTQYNENELVGQPIASLNLVLAESDFFKSVYAIISTGSTWAGEVRCQAKNGTILWVKTTILPIKNSSDKIESYLLFNSNITPTKNALEEKDFALEQIRQGEARYRALVENQPDLISLCRADGTRIYVNESYCLFIGKSAEELIGSNIKKMPLKGMSEFVQAFFQLTADRPEIPGVYQLENGHGKKVWISLCLKGIFDADGKLYEVLTIGRDVTDLKNAELQKVNYIRDLEHIAFMTSHNVRGPIATMLGLLELMRMNAIHSDQWLQIVDSFKKCIVDLDAYTREMGAFIYEKQSSE